VRHVVGDDAHVEPWLERLYARLGRRYVPLLVGAMILGGLAMGAATVAAGAGYLDAGFGPSLRVFAVMGAQMLASIGIGLFAARADLRTLAAWTRAGEPASGAADVWVAALRLPARVMRPTAAVIVAFGWPTALYATSQFDLGTSTWPALYVGAMIALAAGATWTVFAGEVALRPVLLAAVRAGLREPPPAPKRLPLRMRTLLALLSVTVFTAALVGASITGFDDRVLRLVAALVIAVATTVTIGLVHISAITASILQPVQELAAATRRVEAGDYGRAVAVITTDELGDLSRSFNRMVAGLREREALHVALGRYADPEVARRVLDDPGALAGEEVEVTVMFIDIRGFTTAIDGIPPREAVARLNDFFEVVVPVLQAHGGHANKFVGDGLLGVFGVPEHHADHADRALAAACDVHRRVTESFGGRVQVGVGVNTGRVLAGTVGGGGKLEFTVIGDAVNVAARVEELTKETGDGILCTEATRVALEHDGAGLLPRGERVLRGKAEPTPLYAVSR
jgi:class 3 adenylate cyclase